MKASTRSAKNLCQALDLLTGALSILDKIDAPGEIGPALDLAITGLAEALGPDGSAGRERLLVEELQRECRVPDPSDSAPNPWRNPAA